MKMGKRTSLRLPISALDALALYPKSYYLNVSLPLQIFASATAERSYTAQKRVENYFLTTMTKERLSELMRTFLLTFPFIWTAVVRRHKISEGMIFYPALSSTFVSTTHRAISEHIQMVIIPEYRGEIDVGGGEVGEEAVSVRYETNRLAGRMKCVIVTANAPWESVLVGVTGKLYLLIKLTILLGIRGKAKHGRKSSDISLC
ncbi:hypothetical protein T08_10922 [Trichinella sp. T8]|nr:hypothetical protein T08_10922 [Trichinella sp. T8]